jgi:hypothetical protein
MELAIPHLRILDYDRAVAFERELTTQPWGARDFAVHDPLGNEIVVTTGGG